MTKDKYPIQHNIYSYDKILEIMRKFTQDDNIDFDSGSFACIGDTSLYVSFLYKNIFIYFFLDEDKNKSYVIFTYDDNLDCKEHIKNLLLLL